jgi:hypothetical protein
MRKTAVGIITVFLVCAFACAACAVTFEAASERSGVYEAGKFSPGGDGFRGVYAIEEENNRIVLEEVISSDREGRIEEGASYEIINTMSSGGFSALTVSPERKGQKIYTAMREGHLGSLEVLVVGEDFYEYSSMSAGRSYLESGRIEKKRQP